jgi:hypothetical protein
MFYYPPDEVICSSDRDIRSCFFSLAAFNNDMGVTVSFYFKAAPEEGC